MTEKTKPNPGLVAFAVIGVCAILGAAGWAGYRRYVFEQQKRVAHAAADLRCVTMAALTVMTLKSSVERQARVGIKSVGGSHVVTTPELDDEIAKLFAGRDFEAHGMGADLNDIEKVNTLIQSFRARAPEVVAQCQALGDFLEKCLPSFPYYEAESRPECGETQVRSEAEVMGNFFRRNFVVEGPTVNKD